MADEGFKRNLTAILSADIVGYSRLMGDDEEETIQNLNTYHKAMSGLVQQHRKRVVDTTDDNLMAEFSSVVGAVKCAVETQKEITKRNDNQIDIYNNKCKVTLQLTARLIIPVSVKNI